MFTLAASTSSPCLRADRGSPCRNTSAGSSKTNMVTPSFEGTMVRIIKLFRQPVLVSCHFCRDIGTLCVPLALLILPKQLIKLVLTVRYLSMQCYISVPSSPSCAAGTLNSKTLVSLTDSLKAAGSFYPAEAPRRLCPEQPACSLAWGSKDISDISLKLVSPPMDRLALQSSGHCILRSRV